MERAIQSLQTNRYDIGEVQFRKRDYAPKCCSFRSVGTLLTPEMPLESLSKRWVRKLPALPASEDFDESENLDSQTKGKMGELAVLGELLKRGFQVYQPMVDTGIDCLVDVGEGNYKEIQIKSRQDDAIFTPRKFKPKDSFFLICSVSSRRGDYLWVFPSKVFHENATSSKNKKRRDYLQLRIGPESSETY